MLGTAQNKALREEAAARSPMHTPRCPSTPSSLGSPCNLQGPILRTVYPYLKVTFQGEAGSLHAWVLELLRFRVPKQGRLEVSLVPLAVVKHT